MNHWYALTPMGPVTLGNLTPVGQNSGMVGCRWPPNGHQLAACLALPKHCQLWGPFWYHSKELYVPLPQIVYTTQSQQEENQPPESIHLLQWRDRWQVRPEHEGKDIEMLGGRYLIGMKALRSLWKDGTSSTAKLEPLPWQTLTLSHNRREDFQVKDEGGFFAEMTTLLAPGWSILVRVSGEYQPPPMPTLGAGGTPIVVAEVSQNWDWLGDACPNTTGGVLLTGALWAKGDCKISLPYPDVPLKAHAAEVGVPWQTWRQKGMRATALTPGEWMTPAGAVYLWGDRPPVTASGPFPDRWHRHALGYGHLWLFEEPTS